MIDILRELTDELDDDKLNTMAERIREYYKDKGRHSYSEVSTFIFQNKDDDIDYLIRNLREIQKKLSESNPKISNKVFKLIDHIQLEREREAHIKDDYLKQMQSIISKSAEMNFRKVSKMQLTINEQTKQQKKNIDNEFKRQTDEINKINSNLVSVLGIFGAIIVAFFGGLNLLGSILDNMNDISIYRLVFISVITLVGLYNVIFMLLYCISKISGSSKRLWSTCKECSECSQDKSKLKCLYEKYPMLVIYNSVSIWSLITLFYMYVCNKYCFIENLVKICGFNSFNEILIVLFSFVAFVIYQIILIGGVKLFFKRIKNNNKFTCNDTCRNSNVNM